MKRIQQLDFARVAAMLAVILIHVTGAYIGRESRVQILDMNLAFILNQAARFAVPLFVLLSGVSLRLSETERTEHFYRRRILKTGVPYIFWFLVYFFLEDHPGLTVRSFLRAFFLGQAAPHLYFVIVIFQLYLLFPPLQKAAEKAPLKCVLGSFTVSFFIQKLFLLSKCGMDLIPRFIRPYLWLLFPTWLFYFTVGLTLTKNRLYRVQSACIQNAASIFLLTAVYSCLYVLESRASGWMDSIKPSLILYTPLVFACAFALWEYVGRYPAFETMVRFLARHSQTIYFEHVLVLYFFRRFSVFGRGMTGMVLLYLAVTITAAAIACPLDWVARKRK